MEQNEVVMNSGAIKSSEQRNNVEIDLEDGPLFRATIKEYESRTSILKGYLKRILKTAASSLEAKNNLLEQDKLFIEALREAPFTEPLFVHYLNSTWDKLHEQQERLSFCMQNLLISPLQKLYDMDIKTVDNKKRQFEDVSKEYYTNLSKYLSIKTPNTNITTTTPNMNNNNTNNNTTVTSTTINTNADTLLITKNLKEKRNQKAESEFLTKKSEFDLVRFDYYTFLRDLHGGKKEQEILYHLLNHHEKQYAYYQAVAKLLEPYKEGLDELANMIAEASREQKIVNQERDEKRKLLVSKYATMPNDDHATKMERRKSSNCGSNSVILSPPPFMTSISPNTTQSNSPLRSPPIHPDNTKSEERPIGLGISNVDQNSKFKGIRDLQQQDQDLKNTSGRRKEGFLFATSKPIKTMNTAPFDMSSNVNWHKYWCVLSSGQLHEYSNWKKHLETHIDPINLRFATVREARNADRRFCFEVITPNFRRMYQATSSEELSSWIATINNAISSLLNGFSESSTDLKEQHAPKRSSSPWKQAKSLSGALNAAKDKYLKKRHHHHPNEKLVISSPLPIRPQQQQQQPKEEETTAELDLLVQLRKDLSNTICADCSAKSPDWCSLNLGILLCIECSGIHRSLGTHISKVRSLTLDSASFTPDIVQLLLAIGNARSNAIWESQPHQQHQKPDPTDMRETKLKYIQLKYVDKIFVAPMEHYQNPMDILYDAIMQDDIPRALYAIALGADVNQPLNDKQPVIPLLQPSNKTRSSVIKLPVLDVEGNEYLDRRTMVVNLCDLFIVRYALHFALLPHASTTISSSQQESNDDGQSSILSGDSSSSSSAPSSSIHQNGSTSSPQRVFGMAEFLFQNGADVSIEDKGSGRLLADLIGLGYLVDDEAITYLNMKNSLRGQAPIIRTQDIPPPISSLSSLSPSS